MAAKQTQDRSVMIRISDGAVTAVDAAGQTVAEGPAGKADADVVQAAIDYGHPAGRVELATGEYHFDKPVVIDNSSMLCGAGRGGDSGQELAKRITGTQWQWDGNGGERIVFGTDGYVEHPGWTARGLVTSWKAIDRRTVLLKIEAGRENDHYAVLVFKDDLSSFEGFNFHGLRLAKSVGAPR